MLYLSQDPNLIERLCANELTVPLYISILTLFSAFFWLIKLIDRDNLPPHNYIIKLKNN
jgi:hypothetical protein